MNVLFAVRDLVQTVLIGFFPTLGNRHCPRDGSAFGASWDDEGTPVQFCPACKTRYSVKHR